MLLKMHAPMRLYHIDKFSMYTNIIHNHTIILSHAQEGMIRMYNIGQWIRNEYGSIIGNKYESGLSLTQSTYADRCIMSAQVLLAALYPPNSEEIFVPGLMWHPVPVHSTPRHLDKVYVSYASKMLSILKQIERGRKIKQRSQFSDDRS